MSTILHLVTHPVESDSLLQKVLEEQGRSSALKLQVVSLASGEVDYSAVVDAIFASDSVQVW